MFALRSTSRVYRPLIQAPRVSMVLRSSFSTSCFRFAEVAKDGDDVKNPASPQRLTSEEAHYLLKKVRDEKRKKLTRSAALYSASIGILFLTLGFAAVPLYRAICKRTGWAGTPITDSTKFTKDKMVPVDTDKRITVTFTSEVSSVLPWKFTPQQREVRVRPGETALAFYKAKNLSDHDIIGMATYSVTPDHVAQYFSKIQCFCFEEQKLAAGEEVDMPVFFFIDPEFAGDPAMRNIGNIVLHYTFFKAQYKDDESGQLIPVNAKAEAELQQAQQIEAAA